MKRRAATLILLGVVASLSMASAQRYLDRAAIADAQLDQRSSLAHDVNTQPSIVRIPRDPNMIILGDSIVDGWAGYFARIFPSAVIDARVGRQFAAAPGVLSRLFQIPPIRKVRAIVVELGTNGPVHIAQMASFLRVAGKRRIFLVVPFVPRPWAAEVASRYLALAQLDPRVVLVPWNRIATGHPQWFWSDGVHPNAQGIRQLAHAIFWKMLRNYSRSS